MILTVTFALVILSLTASAMTGRKRMKSRASVATTTPNALLQAGQLDICSQEDRSLSYAPPSSPHTAPMLDVLPSLTDYARVPDSTPPACPSGCCTQVDFSRTRRVGKCLCPHRRGLGYSA